MDSGEFQYVFITTRERCIAGSWPAKHHDPKTCSNCCLRRFPIRPYNSRSPMLSSCCHNLLQSSRFHQRYQLVVARDTHKVTPTCRKTQLLHLTRNAPYSRNDQATKSIHEQLDNSQTPNTRKCNTRLHGLHQGKLCRKYLRRVDRIVTHSQQNMWGSPPSFHKYELEWSHPNNHTTCHSQRHWVAACTGTASSRQGHPHKLYLTSTKCLPCPDLGMQRHLGILCQHSTSLRNTRCRPTRRSEEHVKQQHNSTSAWYMVYTELFYIHI